MIWKIAISNDIDYIFQALRGDMTDICEHAIDAISLKHAPATHTCNFGLAGTDEGRDRLLKIFAWFYNYWDELK
jgi:hypothetical protein